MEGQGYREGVKSRDNSTKSSNPNNVNDHNHMMVEREDTEPSTGRANTTSNVNIHTTNAKETEEYLNSFPPGYRFNPEDDELIYYYLERKIKDPSSLPPNKIKNVELYKFNPENLAANNEPIGDNEWYFFTPRDRKYKNGERPSRAAGDGYWKATGADMPILNHNRVKIGSKKTLVFYKGKPIRANKTDWIMHEYTIVNPPRRRKCREDMRLDDVVLCRIRKKAQERDGKEKPAKTRANQRENARQHQRQHVSQPEVAMETPNQNQVMNGQNSIFQQHPTLPPGEQPFPPNPMNPSSLVASWTWTGGYNHHQTEDKMLSRNLSFGAWPKFLKEEIPKVAGNGLPPFPESPLGSLPDSSYTSSKYGENAMDSNEETNAKYTPPPPSPTGWLQEGNFWQQESEYGEFTFDDFFSAPQDKSDD